MVLVALEVLVVLVVLVALVALVVLVVIVVLVALVVLAARVDFEVRTNIQEVLDQGAKEVSGRSPPPFPSPPSFNRPSIGRLLIIFHFF